MPNDQYSQAQLDTLARQRGFADYATWRAYTYKQMAMRQGGPPVTGEQPKNWLQRLLESIPGHPAQTLGYTNDKMKKALGNRK